MKDLIFYLLTGLGLGLAVRDARRRSRRSSTAARASSTSPRAPSRCTACSPSTRPDATGYIACPWVDFLPTDSVNLPVTIKLVRRRGVDWSWRSSSRWRWPCSSGCSPTSSCSDRCASSAALGKVSASVGVMLYLQGVAQLNFGGTGPSAESVLPDGCATATSSASATTTRKAPCSRRLSRSLLGLVLWALFQFTRFGLATRGGGRQREGRGAARLLAAAARRPQLGDRVGAGDAGGDPRRPDPGLAHADRSQRARRRRTRRGADRRAAIDHGRDVGRSRPRCRRRRPSASTRARTGSRASCAPASARSCRSRSIVLVLFLRGKRLPTRGTIEERRLPLSPYPVRLKQHAVVWSTSS